jgi:site-specific DNA recombinase
MKTADLYIRVSTDEQADKGYSQRNQEEVLVKYCESNNISIRKRIFEDHSAKTFVRPEWSKLVTYLKQHRNKSDLILFTKWDRFSRNAPDAYQMIALLKNLGVDPQAVEQPLDMSVPENKMMLAIYLTAPEIENDRRALNIFYGMRRAKKEGRWMATAPVGYANRTLEGGRKTIVFKEPHATILKWAFKEISKGNSTVVDVWRQAYQKGLKCSRSHFWNAIRNPVYIGKIVIPKLKDEESYAVDGLHEPLITDRLYYEVQDVLNGRKRVVKSKVVSTDLLSLKGFIICPNCKKALTGSASKGCRNYYHYYHCTSPCRYRQNAVLVNKEYESLLSEFSLNPKAKELFKLVILHVYENSYSMTASSKRNFVEQVTLLNNKISKARELLLDGDIDASDFKAIKSENEYKINVLESKISDLKSELVSLSEVNTLIDKATANLFNVGLMFNKSDAYDRREMISSIFVENFTFEEIKVRTMKLTEPFKLIYLINKKLNDKKKEIAADFLPQSHGVLPTRFELISMVPETIILSIELREQYCANITYFPFLKVQL